MSRKDYCLLASVLLRLKDVSSHNVWLWCVKEFAAGLAADNPRFKAEKFYRACGMTSQKEAA